MKNFIDKYIPVLFMGLLILIVIIFGNIFMF